MPKVSYQFGSRSDAALRASLQGKKQDHLYPRIVAEQILAEQGVRATVRRGCGLRDTCMPSSIPVLSQTPRWRSAVKIHFPCGNKLRLTSYIAPSGEQLFGINSFDSKNRSTSLVHDCLQVVNPPVHIQNTAGYTLPIGGKYLSQLVSLCFAESDRLSALKERAAYILHS